MILFFGCWTDGAGNHSLGHHYRTHTGDTRQRHQRPDGTLSEAITSLVPWGYAIDGRLAPRTEGRLQAPPGVAGFHQAISWVGCPSEEAWSALAWWDNSVDRRPGANCAFLVDRRATPGQILVEARIAFPQIFARFAYSVVLPKEG